MDWEKGPDGHFMHNSCYTTLSSKRNFTQAVKRKEKLEESEHLQREEISTEHCPKPEGRRCKTLRSSMGEIHDKSLCVWCMKGVYKQSDRGKQLLLLSTVDAWTKFKLHTIQLEDVNMRERLNTLIASIPDSHTAFGVEIRYHRMCWRNYVSHPEQKQFTDENIQHLQHVNLREAQTLFYHHVRQVIFNDHEIRTLQGLLQDYKRIISNHGHNPTVKSSFLKEILLKEFGNDIGFHKRIQKNASEVVYDTTAAGSYVEAILSLFGISRDQLVKNVAAGLK